MKPLLFAAASWLPLNAFAVIDIQPHVLEIQQTSGRSMLSTAAQSLSTSQFSCIRLITPEYHQTKNH